MAAAISRDWCLRFGCSFGFCRKRSACA